MPAHIYRKDEGGNTGHKLGVFVGVSMACHLFFLAALIYVPAYKPSLSFSQPVINVSIVSLPAPAGAPSKTAVTPAPDQKVPALESEEKISLEPPESQAVSLSPKPYKPKTSLKKKTFKPSNILKKAISDIEKKVENSKPDPVARAIDHLRNTLAQTGEGESGETGLLPGSSRNSQGTTALDIMDIYKAEIPYRIQKNWAFSEQLAGGNTDLAAWLVIEIMPDGEIRDIWFEKRSGNRYFDDQAYKAVKKSNPLPPLPEGFSRPFFNVGLRFTPSGLK